MTGLIHECFHIKCPVEKEPGHCCKIEGSNFENRLFFFLFEEYFKKRQGCLCDREA